MELKITELTIPGRIEFNFEELKAELTEKAALYASVVYDEEHIKQAKADKAALNKLKSALNDERIRREREYMAPFMQFKAQIAEIITIIDKPVSMIDKQIKEFEAKEQQEKRNKIIELFDSLKGRPEWLRIEQIWDPRWLNKSISFRMIEDNLLGWMGRIDTETKTLESLGDGSFEAMEVYKQTLDLGKAVAEGKRMAEIQRAKKQQEEQKESVEEKQPLPWQGEEKKPLPLQEEEKQPEPVPVRRPEETEEQQWIQFEALLTVDKAEALADFCRENGIQIRAL